MRLLILVFWFSITFSSFAQTNDSLTYDFDTEVDTPFNPKSKDNNFAIKGIILPAPWSNGWIMSSYLGFEYGFYKRHSIGIDGMIGYLGDKSEKDIEENTYITNTRERAIFVNYRYYFESQNLRKKGFVPYVSCYYRYGVKLKDHSSSTFSESYNRNETNNSVGLVLGAINSDSVFDWNVGVFYKEKEITTNNVNFEKKSSIGVRVGLYIYCYFIRKNKK